ncbi:TlpA family protein disulfide reductase [Nocardioides sp.]|uniref:Putative thioredoxin-like protein n=1 Tax=metagenome TaxID=256318 RepID=A0A2P2BX49_9ZZZZ
MIASDRARVLRVMTALAIAAGLVGVVVWQANQIQTGASESESTATGPGLTVFLGSEGIELPAITGRTLSGRRLSLEEFGGHVVVLSIWSSSCEACRAEALDLAALKRETKPLGVRFVGIDVRDRPSDGRTFQRRAGLVDPSLDDSDGRVLDEIRGTVAVDSVPSTLLVDADGLIRARWVGKADAITLRDLIAEMDE